MAKKKVKKKEEEEYYTGVTFLAFQSGSANEPSKKVLRLIKNFTIGMHEERIRTYTVLQMGKPGGCHNGICH